MKTKILSISILISISIFFLNGKRIDNISNEKENNYILKNNDVYVVNAAMIDPYNKAYFFVGKYFHKYNFNNSKLEKVAPLAGFAELVGVPFNVDAAILHPQSKKGYIFKGNVYYRYNFKNKKVEKEGVISEGWKGLQGPIDAAITHPTNNSAYFFKGNKYYRYSFTKKKIDKVGTINQDGWKGVPIKADAAFIHSNGKAYFFKNDTYFRYDFSKKKIDRKGTIGVDGFKGIFKNIDAADKNEFFRSSYLYFWSSEQKKSIIEWGVFASVQKIEYKKEKISFDKYKGIPSNIDAVLTHPKSKKKYFFKQNQYYRYDESLNKVDKIGTIGKNGWSGVPNNIDAAFSNSNGKIYFFKENKYYRFDLTTKKVDKIASIKDNWIGVPDNVDAVRKSDKTKVFFYKKSIEYVYDSSKRKVVKWNFIPNDNFK